MAVLPLGWIFRAFGTEPGQAAVVAALIDVRRPCAAHGLTALRLAGTARHLRVRRDAVLDPMPPRQNHAR